MMLLCSTVRVASLALALFVTTHSAPVRLIIDTDFGGGGCRDVDDVVALAIAHALMTRGEAELLAVMLNTAPARCSGAIDVINRYYGRDGVVPVGAYDVKTPNATLETEEPLPYINYLVDRFPATIKNSSQAEDAVALYRKVLAVQPDRSVTISSIGILTNLAALLRSEADRHSSLNGRDLIEQKVRLLAVMGGRFPASGLHAECNLCGGQSNRHNQGVASAASSFVARHWPAASEILWSGFEVGMQVRTGGARFQKCATAAVARNPVAAAIVNYRGGPDQSWYSWDPLTTLVAVRGAEAVGCFKCRNCIGVNAIDSATGRNAWVSGQRSNQTYLLLHDAKKASKHIDDLLCQPPMVGSLSV